ncbi:tetratricopeptide repeat protein [Streptomyces sp. NBC_00328]|uniref:tetratricopeptide repeat protein n=1 Tax=Streptomyces sp. NBC_00328 TaxID=2903646 RepID=UPI002E2950D8|nr:tetratricopeptide repeat protein [Streptomyces sp. NBC_00328]
MRDSGGYVEGDADGRKAAALAELRARLENAVALSGLNKDQLVGRIKTRVGPISRTTVFKAFQPGAPVPTKRTVAVIAAGLKLPEEQTQELLDLQRTAASKPVPAPETTSGPGRKLGRPVDGTGAVAGVGDNHGPTIPHVTQLPPTAIRWAAETEARGESSLRPPKATFTGRADELAAIRTELLRRADGVGIPVVVVHGLGGVGKTELARQYAQTHRHSYDLVWWIDAAAPGAVDAALAEIAVRLSPFWGGTVPSERALTAWALSWLQQHDNWLLVYDNVEDPNLLWPHLGSLGRGHHLITSRHTTGWKRRGTLIGLDVLPRKDSVALLNAWEPFSSLEEEWHAGQLAKELGDLPLALEQAAAYMAQTVTSIQSYRDSLAEQLDEAAQDHSGEEQTVARVWKLTLTALEETVPLAVELLHVLAWLDPDNCPRFLLAPLAPGKVPVPSALGWLSAFSMVSLTDKTVSVHRLVQTVLRDKAIRHASRETAEGSVPPPPRGRPQAGRVLLEAVYPDGAEAAPDEAPDEAVLALLAPHVIALSGTDPGDYRPDLARLFGETSVYLHRQGQIVRSLPVRRAYARQVVAGFGPDDRTALIGCDALASALVAAGEFDDVIDDLKELRKRSTRALGPGDLTTLNIRATLASAYQDSGRLEAAVKERIDASAVAAEHLGPEHARTLTLRNDLARAYEYSGRYEQAIEIYEDLLRHEELLVRWEGNSAPLAANAAQVRNNLAGAYASVGRHEEALAHYHAALSELTHLLGPGHPTTVDCLSNLGYTLEAAGRIDEASPYYQEAWKQRLTSLGEDHPDTLLSQSNLAYLHLKKGEVDTGLQLCRQTLVQREQILGPTHVDTLVSRNLLASALAFAGKPEEAVDLYETTLGQRREVLGSGHPQTLLTLAALALCRLQLGNAAAAVPLLEEARTLQEQLSGPDSPDTLRHLHNLAAACREAGALDRARELFTTALDRRTQVLGAKHFETLITLSGLARLHQADGDLEHAIPLYEDAIAGLTEALGPDHPTTRTVSGYLAEARTP